MSGRAEALAAAAVIRERVTGAGFTHLDALPVAGIVLGSGLGGLAKRVVRAARIPYSDIPGFAPSTVHGHAGEMLIGELAGRPVILQAGRFHLYEGHDAATAAFPVRVMHALGARTLIVSNAAGGIRRTFRPGDLMVIADHLNLMFQNPLIGRVVTGDERFPDMSDPYDPALRRLLHEVARGLGQSLVEGVYAGLLGPTYETPSEVRMLERMGADATGMSTVPEVIVARAMGMRVAGVSCITNPAAGISPTPLNHAEVLETSARVAGQFEALIEGVIARLERNARVL
jgi:purine-nucleoside phosphorylase